MFIPKGMQYLLARWRLSGLLQYNCKCSIYLFSSSSLNVTISFILLYCSQAHLQHNPQ